MKRIHLLGAIALIAAITMLLFLTISDNAYAKGAVRSGRAQSEEDQSSRKSKSDDKESSKVRQERKSSSERDTSQRSERNSNVERNRERQRDSDTERNVSRRSERNSNVERNRERQRDSDTERNVSRRSERNSNVERNRERQRDSDTERNNAKGRTNQPQLRERGERVEKQPPVIVRSENRFRKETTARRGDFRKKYDDIGKIIRDRIEKRTRVSHRRIPRHDKGVDVNFYFFPSRYRHYDYFYRPGYTFPSPYCLYVGYFPPYILGTRIMYLPHRFWGPFIYVDLPDMIIYDYAYDSYPYASPKYRYLSTTLRDIRRGWEHGDPDLFMRHVREYSRIDVFMWNEYAYTLDWQDFQDMTLDALDSIDTVDFDFYKLRQRNSNEVVAYAKHTYYDDFDDSGRYYSGKEFRRTVYISYTLQRFRGDWYITEVSFSPDRLY